MCVWDTCHRPCVCSWLLATGLELARMGSSWWECHQASGGWVTCLWAPCRRWPWLQERHLCCASDLPGGRAHS